MAAYSDARALNNYGVYAGFVAAPLAVAELLIEMTRTVFSGVSEVVAPVAKLYKHWNVRRTTLRQLSALSDRQLLDIGLVRGDLEGVVDALS